MFLSLQLYNFRNLENSSIDLSAKEVFFVGQNGQGKSNLLEALYYSSYGNSFRTHVESEIVKKNESEMSVRSMFREENGSIHTTALQIKPKSKKIEKDGKFIQDRKELINTMPCVLYNHDDLDFAVGEPERRRFFLDQSLSMYDVMYIDLIRKYKKILKSRNNCLKEKNYNLLEVYDTQLVMSGLEIQKKRKDAVFKFNQIFGNIYEEVTGIEGVKIRYNSSWKKESNDDDSTFGDLNVPSMEKVMEKLFLSREAEKIMCTTMSGPHRDRILFERKSEPFIPTASTGQRRLIALILRTAQAVYYKQVTGKKPVLLMDDVMLELDPEKRRKFTCVLPDYDQLFCTFLAGEPYENYKKQDTKIFKIENGKWKMESNKIKR